MAYDNPPTIALGRALEILTKGVLAGELDSMEVIRCESGSRLSTQGTAYLIEHWPDATEEQRGIMLLRYVADRED